MNPCGRFHLETPPLRRSMWCHHSGAKCDLTELLRVLLCEEISGHNEAITRLRVDGR